MNTILEFIKANPGLAATLSALLSVLVHAGTSGKLWRVAMAIQAVSIDMPKLIFALTSPTPPPPASAGKGDASDATKTPVMGTTVKRERLAQIRHDNRIAWAFASTVSGLLLMSTIAIATACSSCTPAERQQVSTLVTPTLEGGCKFLVGITVDGVPVGAVCDTLVTVLGPIISQEIAKADKARGDAAAELHFMPIAKGGQTIGYVRADIVAAVQAKIDGAP